MAPKIAIVHDWLITFAGSERVIEQLLQVFPNADLFTLMDFLEPKNRGFLKNKAVRTSFLQTFPFVSQKNYRQFLPLMPLAIEQLDFSGYDIVISNCHAVSKAVITGPEQLHISYIHSPMRYAWDMQNSYLETSGLKSLKGALARLLLHYIRLWDSTAANRPDHIYGNSGFICRRIQKVYRRDARILYPPVDTDTFALCTQKEDFYLAASRFVPYKRMDLIAEAFARMPDKKLVLIGDGPEAYKVKTLNLPNVTWLGYQPSDVLRDYMQRAKAFIFAAKEDFGIIPLEAQACGTPVVAFGEGGVRETVCGPESSTPTGIFFHEQTADALQAAVLEFEQNAGIFQPSACRVNAERFSNERFRREVHSIVESTWVEFQHQSRVNA